MTADTFTITGEAVEKIKLPKELFEIKPEPKLLAQAVRVYLANQREAAAKTKTRGEVAKTTAKMYKQKGTGRARHGSYSAPIFVGGGVSHGPSGEQNHKLKMPVQMRRLALLEALTDRAIEKAVIIITQADKATGKTKDAVLWVKKNKLAGQKMLLVTGKEQIQMRRGWKNLSRVTVIYCNQLNPYLIMAHKQLVMTAEAVEEATKLYAN